MVSHKGSCTSYSRDKSSEKQRSSATIASISDKKGEDIAYSLINHRSWESIRRVLAFKECCRRQFEIISPSYKGAAKASRIARSTYAYVLNILEEHGIMSHRKIPFHSNQYTLSEVFVNAGFRRVIARYEKIFFYLSFSLLVSFNKISTQEYRMKQYDIKYEKFLEYSSNGTASQPITGSLDRKEYNIKSLSKEYNQSLYITDDNSDPDRRPESQRGASIEGSTQSSGDTRREPSQVADNIRARIRLTPTAVRAAMLLHLEGDDRYQLLDYSDDELNYAAEMLGQSSGIMDKVRWFKSVCLKYRNGEGRRKPSNYSQNQRDSRAQYNRQGEGRSGQPREPLSAHEVKPLPNRYKCIERCTKDDEGAQYNAVTGVWYREVWREKRVSSGPVTKPTHEELVAAFARNPSSDPFFNSIKDVILNKVSRGKDLDFGVIAEGINAQTYGMDQVNRPTAGNTKDRAQKILEALRSISDNTR